MTDERWITPDGQWLTVIEVRPGVVEVSTELLRSIFIQLGLVRMPEDPVTVELDPA